MTTRNPITDPAEGGDVPSQLLAAVRNLDAAVRQLAKRLRWVVIGGALTTAIAVFAVFMFIQLNDTQNELRGTINQVSETRMDVLCPLYGIFLASYDPDSPQARQDPERYEAAFQVIRDGAAVLGCPVTPPS